MNTHQFYEHYMREQILVNQRYDRRQRRNLEDGGDDLLGFREEVINPEPTEPLIGQLLQTGGVSALQPSGIGTGIVHGEDMEDEDQDGIEAQVEEEVSRICNSWTSRSTGSSSKRGFEPGFTITSKRSKYEYVGGHCDPNLAENTEARSTDGDASSPRLDLDKFPP